MNDYHIIEPPKTTRINFKELWQYRELLYYFTWRDIKVKYKETTLGVAWVIIQPIALTIIFVMIFSRGLNISSKGLPYPVFVLSGLILWNLVASSITNAVQNITNNTDIIKKTYFPRLIIPISAVTLAAFDFIFGIILLSIVCIWYDVKIYSDNLLYCIPISMSLLVLSSLGLACTFSVLNAIFKDFRYVIPFAIQVLFFTTPVFYDQHLLSDGWWKVFHEWNPFSMGIHFFRLIFIESIINFTVVLKPISIALFLFLSGIFIFKKLEPKLPDLI